jgi:hypothetical protein
MATLRDLDPQPFVIAEAGERPVTAGDRWVVLVGDGVPVSAIAPGTTLAEGARPPGILVAPADLNLAAAFESAAFRQFAEVSALVLTEPAEGDAAEQRIAGVVSGLTLGRALFRGPTRSLSGPVLPGTPGSISWIARSCGFTDRGVLCATPMTFLTRPYPMPDCPNNRGLAAHQFAW